MKKIRMCVDTDKTFAEGFEEYILDCKSRNLRDGTLRHYRESIKQIYKRAPPRQSFVVSYRPARLRWRNYAGACTFWLQSSWCWNAESLSCKNSLAC